MYVTCMCSTILRREHLEISINIHGKMYMLNDLYLWYKDLYHHHHHYHGNDLGKFPWNRICTEDVNTMYINIYMYATQAYK